MKQIVLYIATSLDGYIAKPDGNIDWLTQFPNPTQSDHGYNDLLESIDTILMGGSTYRDILNMDIDWPYKNFKTYVITRKTLLPDVNVEFISEEVLENIKRIKENAHKNIWLVGGGQLVTLLLNENLIDEMQISYIPIILGAGIPLFPSTPKESNWSLINHTIYESGIVKLDYVFLDLTL